MEPLPAYMVEQGRQDALDAVRRAVASPRNPVASDDNPLGLPLDADGQAATLRLVTIKETKCGRGVSDVPPSAHSWQIERSMCRPSIVSTSSIK